MKLEMICTGEEVLSGQIVDTNGAWLSNVLMENGYEMQRRTIVGDRLQDLASVFIERSQQAEIILVNGGLGPTADDLCALAMANAMGVELEENQRWRQILQDWFNQRGMELSKSNLKQALLPEGAIMIENSVGTACGFRVKFNRAWLFFTPGVPHEFMQMVEDTFIPFISSLTSQISSVSVVKLLTLGMGESTMAEKLEPLTWPEGITLGYRSYTPYLELKLIGRDLAPGIQDQAEAIAKKILADTIVANNQPSLASEVHRLLVNSGKTLSIAESLTGGEISSQLVALPGSSAYLKHAIVSYCNEAKINLLAVSPKTIEQHTEVSLACVAQMAAGVSKANGGPLSYDFSIATSGIAGPGGGTQALPVGTVVIALKTPQQIHCQRLRLSQKRSRQYIRELCVAVALDMLRRAILNLVPIADYGYIECAQQQIFEINDSLMG